MSKRMKGCLIGGILLYALISITAFLLIGVQRRNLDSPATASRDVVGFRDGRLGLLEKTSETLDPAWPAGVEMAAPELFQGAEGSFLVDWSRETKAALEVPPDRWSEGLLGDDQVELVAFASWVPEAADPHTDPNWRTGLTLRDPASTRALSIEELAALEVPESFRSLDPPRLYQTPVLRLIFRTAGMPYPHSPSMAAGDARTGAQVSYDLQDSNDGSPRRHVEGIWLRVDTDLLLWHDTPLTCHVQFLTGEPEIADLPRSPGAQVAFGDHLRIQWLARVERYVSIRSWLNEFTPSPDLPTGEQEAIRNLIGDANDRPENRLAITPDTDEEPGPLVLVRTSSEEYLEEHCGWMTDSGIVWNWERRTDEDDRTIAWIDDPAGGGGPMRLVFLPQITELTFQLPGLPDMPNSRATKDLFDCVVPRISLPEDLDDAETQLLGFIGVGAQLAWESSNRWDDHPPKNLPPDRTFRGQTPQELLDWYLDHTPGAWVRYDPEGLVLHINEEEPSWWSQMREKLVSLRYVF